MVMEKKKWLWKKKSSSEKSSGDSESSGSMSSQSENCLEEHQFVQELYREFTKESPNHGIQSPGVASKETFDESQEEKNSTIDNSLLKKFSEADQENVPESKLMEEVNISNGSQNHGGQQEEDDTSSNGNEENENIRLLKEKLSAALINVSLKDELVKQHTKVAEEAVAGWEKAEDEVATLKEQLDITVQNNSTLEARLSHLDEALKECVRQLRLSKEEHEQKISEALAEKNKEYEVSKSKLESQILELKTKVEASIANPPVVADTGILLKLEFLERENQSLKNELMSQSEELEITTIERDLSTKAAEAASKQNLDNIKMVAKLESECRKLKALSSKSSALNKGQNQKSPSNSSYFVDSVTNSQSETSEPARSDSWATALMAELDQFKNERSLGRSSPSSSVKIDLMDDFLEMERLAGMQENGHVKLESPKHPSEKSVEIRLREELKEITCRAVELEEKVRKLESEKAELEMNSTQTQLCLESSQVELIQNKMKLEELEAELQEVSELKMEFESYANDLKLEAQAMMSKIEFLQEEIDRQRVGSETLSARCQELEFELDGKNKELEVQHNAASKSKLEENEKALAELQIQIKEAMMKLDNQSLESKNELVEKETALSESQKCVDELQIQLKEVEMKLEKQSAAYKSELEEKEKTLSQRQVRLDELQIQLQESAMKLEKLKMELDEANKSKECLLSNHASAREEVGRMSAMVDSLHAQIDKEQAISAEFSAKCEELKKEVEKKQQQLELQQNEPVYIEQKINQEDVASAARKLAECQKTIASLGNQLKSLATLEDFFMDTASIPKFSGSAPIITKGGGCEMWKLHSNNVHLTQKKCDAQFQEPQEGVHTFSKYIDGDMLEPSSSTMFNYSISNGNGYEKLFPMRRS